MADHAEPESDAGVKQADRISKVITGALENVSILEEVSSHAHRLVEC